MSLSINIGRPFLNDKTLDEQARSILRLYGTDAHVYLPGANGVAVSGLPTNNYTLSDGSTGYSAVDGTAGLVLDAAGAVGAECYPSGLVGATLSGGATISTATVTLPSASAQAIAASYTSIANTTYQIDLSVSSAAGAYLNVYIGGAAVFGVVSGAFTGTKRVFIKATSTTGLIVQSDAGATGSCSVTLLACVPVTGIHATQATTANKPAVRRGLYNLLTYSNDLSNAAHTKSAVSVSGQKIVEDSTTANHYLADTSTIAAAPYTHAVRVTAAEHMRVLLRENSVTGAASTFDLSNGTVLGNENGASGSIVAVGDGSYICATTRTFSAGSTQFGVFLVPNTGTNFASCSYAGNGSAGLTVNQVALFAGTLTAAQILSEGGIPLTTSAAASNQSAGRYSWGVDTDDSLVFGAVPFQFTDDYFVCIGAACNNKASYPGVLDATGGTARMYLYFDASGVVVSNYKTDAAVDAYVQGPAFVDGATGVISMYKQSGQVCTGWNGVDGTPVAAPAGTYTITAAKLSNLLNGRIAPCVIIKGTVSAADRLTIKRWVASLTPNGPTF